MKLNTLVEIERNFVTPTWVAKYYGVTRLQVHRAIERRLLSGARVRGAGRDSIVLDRRTLPTEFPRSI